MLSVSFFSSFFFCKEKKRALKSDFEVQLKKFFNTKKEYVEADAVCRNQKFVVHFNILFTITGIEMHSFCNSNDDIYVKSNAEQLKRLGMCIAKIWKKIPYCGVKMQS